MDIPQTEMQMRRALASPNPEMALGELLRAADPMERFVLGMCLAMRIRVLELRLGTRSE